MHSRNAISVRRISIDIPIKRSAMACGSVDDAQRSIGAYLIALERRGNAVDIQVELIHIFILQIAHLLIAVGKMIIERYGKEKDGK